MAAEQLAKVRELASRQYGLIRAEQAREFGISRALMRNEVEHGRLLIIGSNLFEVAGAPHTTGWEAMAAALDTYPIGCVSHLSATAWWGLPGRPLRPWHITRDRGSRGESQSRVVAHEPRSFLPEHAVLLRGVPVTTPARTVFDLAASTSPAATESALDAFWSRGLVNIGQLNEMMAQVGGRGRAGTVLMRDLISARSDEAFLPTESGLELRFAKLMKDAGLKPLDRQVPLADGGGWIGRFDFVDRTRKIVVEVQSERYHSTLSDRERDHSRRTALEADGWHVVEVWDSDLWHRPDAVLMQIHNARAA